MTIDYGKIVTNALSTLVAAVFVGAAVIVWNAATSIDERIEESRKDLLSEQDRLTATQETIVPELAGVKEELLELKTELENIRVSMEEEGLLSDITTMPWESQSEQELSLTVDVDPTQSEIERINERIEVLQMENYQKRTAPSR